MYSFEEVREIFKEWQSYSNRIDVLKPYAWETQDEVTLTHISYEIALLKEKQIDVLVQDNRKENLEEFFTHYLNKSDLNELDAAELRENYRWFAHTAYVPKELSTYFQAMTADMEAKWALFEHIKQEKGTEFAWEHQAEYLEKSFAIRREMAEHVAEVLKIKPSEVTLDFWNPHFRNRDIDAWIAELDEKVKPIIRAHFLSPRKNSLNVLPHPHLEGHMSAIQTMFSDIRNALLEAAGWDEKRLKKEGVKLHPMTFGPNGFCWGDPSEMRMCVEFVGGDFMRGLGLVIHEGTHLLYVLSCNEAQERIKGTPAGWTNGSSIHETCALSMEQAFYKKEFAPLIEELVVHYLPDVVFDEQGNVKPEWNLENIIQILTVQDKNKTGWYDSEISLLPNMIYRTLAERKIIDGELEVINLPEFWAKTMEEWTGLPHNPKDFFVEESHWFDDNAGYFWAYQFGAMVGSAVQEEVAKKPKLTHTPLNNYHDDLMARIKHYFKPHIDYLNATIFQKHCVLTPLQISQSISGEKDGLVDSYKRYVQSLVDHG